MLWSIGVVFLVTVVASASLKEAISDDQDDTVSIEAGETSTEVDIKFTAVDVTAKDDVKDSVIAVPPCIGSATQKTLDSDQAATRKFGGKAPIQLVVNASPTGRPQQSYTTEAPKVHPYPPYPPYHYPPYHRPPNTRRPHWDNHPPYQQPPYQQPPYQQPPYHQPPYQQPPYQQPPYQQPPYQQPPYQQPPYQQPPYQQPPYQQPPYQQPTYQPYPLYLPYWNYFYPGYPSSRPPYHGYPFPGRPPFGDGDGDGELKSANVDDIPAEGKKLDDNKVPKSIPFFKFW